MTLVLFIKDVLPLGQTKDLSKALQFRMNLKIPHLLLLSLLGLMACRGVFHSPQQPTDEPRLMVQGFTVPGEPFALKVGRFNPGNDNNKAVTPAAKATVSISLEGKPQTELEALGEGFFRSKNWMPRAGKQYQVEIAHPDIKTLTAEAYLPRPIRVSIDNFKVVKRLDKGDPILYHMNLKWKDPPDETNYYEISAQAVILDEKGQVKGQPRITLLASKPGYETHETKSLLIHDRHLKGEKVSIPVYADARFDVEGKLAGFRVELRHVNKAYFDNTRSLPPTLPSTPTSRIFKKSSSVKEGFGYIACYSTSIASVGAY